MPVIKKPNSPQNPPSQPQPDDTPIYAWPTIPIDPSKPTITLFDGKVVPIDYSWPPISIDPSKPTYTLDDGTVIPTVSTLNTCNINVDDPNKCPQVCWDIKKNNPDHSMGPCKLTDKLYNCASC